jgi:phage baseplate assembly protein V
MSTLDDIRREVDRGLRGVRSAFRGVLRGITRTTQVQRARFGGLAGEELADAEVMQHFGFSSAIPEGADVIVVPVGGRTAQSVVIASELGSVRIQLGAAGETVIYSQWGDRVHLRQDRSILIQAASQVNVQAPLATFSGNVQVAGNVQIAGNLSVTGTSTGTGAATFSGGVTGAGVTLQAHVHSGVQPGGGNTGGPT